MPGCPSQETLRNGLPTLFGLTRPKRSAPHVAECRQCQGVVEQETEHRACAAGRPEVYRRPHGRTPASSIGCSNGQRQPWRDRELSPLGRRGDSTLVNDVADSDGAHQPRNGSSPVREGALPDGALGRIEHIACWEMGHGGMGIVLLAGDRIVVPDCRHQSHSLSNCADATDRPAFARRRRSLPSLRHDHAVTIHAVVETADGLPYLVMEHVEGPTLAALALQQRAARTWRSQRIVAQVALALEAAHAPG